MIFISVLKENNKIILFKKTYPSIFLFKIRILANPIFFTPWADFLLI